MSDVLPLPESFVTAEMTLLVEDRRIRDLYARYCDAVWRRDGDAFADCFAPGAVWKIVGLEMDGRKTIRTQFEAFVAEPHRVMMFTGLPNLSIGSATATSRISITEYSRSPEGAMTRTLGVYYDRLVRDDAAWRFSHRHLDLNYAGAADFADSFIDRPDYGPPPAMPTIDAPTLP